MFYITMIERMKMKEIKNTLFHKKQCHHQKKVEHFVLPQLPPDNDTAGEHNKSSF